MASSLDPQHASALWYTAPGQAEIRTEHLAEPSTGELGVHALFGALSRGTESLIAAGRVPPEEYERMRAPFMAGSFPFPVKYGYSTVVRISSGPPELVGKMGFTLYPHQSAFNLSVDAIHVLPEGLPPQRAVLAANMETALNAVWNAAPGPGDRIAVVGGGVVGLLVAYLCGQIPGTEVTLVDINPDRKHIALTLGVNFSLPDHAPNECDLVVHASGSSSGLNTAIHLAGHEASILELSWFGSNPVTVNLGGAFHSRQLKLISSQVGHVAISRRPRWTYSRRLAAAIRLLDDARLDALLAPAIPFSDLPSKLPDIFNPTSGILCQLIQY